MKKLNVFDFDNTLFNSPADNGHYRNLYEKETGIPWIISKELAAQLSKKLKRKISPRHGWWGRAESLQPPIVPDPPPKDWLLPTHIDLLESKKDPTSVSIIMTGRHAGLKQHVLRILYHYDILNIVKEKDWFINNDAVSIYCLGENGPLKNEEFGEPKPNQTFPWKCWIISQFLLLYPLENVEIWEDREEHVNQFIEFGKKFPTINFKINHVK